MNELMQIHGVAAYFGHDWAQRLSWFDINECKTLEDAQRKYDACVDNDENAQYLPAGIAPALEHVTATGRTRWSVSSRPQPTPFETADGIVMHYKDLVVVDVEIQRRGDVPVLQASLWIDIRGLRHAVILVGEDITDCGIPARRPAQRHVLALFEVMQAWASPTWAFAKLAKIYDEAIDDLTDAIFESDERIRLAVQRRLNEVDQ